MSRTTLVLMALAGTVGATAAPVPKGVKKPNYFPLAIGSKWEFQDSREAKPVRHEVIQVTEEPGGAKTVLVSFGNTPTPGVITYRLSADGVDEVQIGGEKLDPPERIATADLKPGAEWKTQFQYGRREYRSDWRVGAAETVTMPAGKFHAIPVTCVRPDETGAGTDEITTWYADGVGVVKLEARSGSTTITRELIRFTPGK